MQPSRTCDANPRTNSFSPTKICGTRVARRSRAHSSLTKRNLARHLREEAVHDVPCSPARTARPFSAIASRSKRYGGSPRRRRQRMRRLITATPASTGKGHHPPRNHEQAAKKALFCTSKGRTRGVLDKTFFGPKPTGTTLFLREVGLAPDSRALRLRAGTARAPRTRRSPVHPRASSAAQLQISQPHSESVRRSALRKVATFHHLAPLNSRARNPAAARACSPRPAHANRNSSSGSSPRGEVLMPAVEGNVASSGLRGKTVELCSAPGIEPRTSGYPAPREPVMSPGSLVPRARQARASKFEADFVLAFSNRRAATYRWRRPRQDRPHTMASSRDGHPLGASAIDPPPPRPPQVAGGTIPAGPEICPNALIQRRGAC